MKFEAAEIRFSELDEDECAQVWLANLMHDPPRYFTMCRELRGPVQQPLYLERDDQKWGAYGSVIRASLAATKLILELEESTARSLDCAPVIEINLKLEHADLIALKRCLIALIGHGLLNVEL